MYPNPNTSHRRFKLILFLLLSPLIFHGQSLTGLWIGTLSNDSTTVRKDQSFEIALTEYRGKVYGYSRSEFIVDDVLYYIVKKVSGTIDGDVCEVMDDEILSYNFPKLLDKKIKVTSTFRRNKTDSTWYLEGSWKTNATKKYYAITGKVDLEEEKDLTASKIFPHLEELKMADNVAFYKERKEGIPIVKIAKPERVYAANIPKTDAFTISSGAIEVADKPVIQPISIPAVVVKASEEVEKRSTPPVTPAHTAEEKTTGNVSRKTAPGQEPIETKNMPANQVVATSAKSNPPITAPPVIEKQETENQELRNPVVTANAPEKKTEPPVNTRLKQETAINRNDPVKTAETNKTELAIANQKNISKPAAIPTAKNDLGTTANSKTVSTPPVAEKKTPVNPVVESPVVVKTNTAPAPVMREINKPTIDVTLKAALIAGRKSEFSQQVNFKSDSLQISLYDNGEIDGDTVSVFMNGEVILSKQGLKSAAIRKTLYLTPGKDDEFTLVLFAENLGKYPPNTGLLVVRDGDDVYNLRFSSDFQKNAGIVFRRKK